ncbi:MAG: preprotein translocase subunit TatC [Phycisphaerales bacterium]|nr:twin-arginine translocase subunit TatC [Phycisphaerae bacterium]NNF45099.1 preprotein translocase subunit TatC [Phycisphaerales bacterium]NNM25141.1 preprotein translocase subunit TatC [Phycisphaerales bacterium]
MPTLPHDPHAHTMTFGDHLEELRKRLLFALAAPLPLFIVLFFFSDTLIEWILLPVYDVLAVHGLPPDLQVLSPPEFLITKLKVALIGALTITTPWLIWQAWLFIAPGLYQHERRFVRLLIPGSAVLTVAGVALMYFVMLPLMLHVLIMFAADMRVPVPPPSVPAAVTELVESTPVVEIRTRPPAPLQPGMVWLQAPEMELRAAVAGDDDGTVAVHVVPPPRDGRIDQTFRVSFVVNFTLVLMLGIIVAFQMPLVILLLGWLGFVNADWLRRQRKSALAVCGVVAAIITPADAVSMVLMLLPLYGLYELGIVLLVVAPAHAVVEGRVFRWRPKRADNPPATADQPRKPVQSEKSVSRETGPADAGNETDRSDRS